MKILAFSTLLLASGALADELWECYELGVSAGGPSIQFTVAEDDTAVVETLRQKMIGVRLYDDLAMVIKFKPMPWEFDPSPQTGKPAVEENDPKYLDYGYILKIEADGHAKLYEDREDPKTILATICRDVTK